MAVTAKSGAWRVKWEGGRLADVFYGSDDDAVDCVQVGAYDWQADALHSEPTAYDLRVILADWVRDHGQEYYDNVVAYR